MVDNVLNALVTQIPDLAALIVVVMIFVRTLEKRDKQYMIMMQSISAELKKLDTAFAAHAAETSTAVNEMHRTVARQERKSIAKRKRTR